MQDDAACRSCSLPPAACRLPSAVPDACSLPPEACLITTMNITTPFEKMAAELDELNQQLSDPQVIADQNLFRDLSRRHAELSPAIELWHEFQAAEGDREEAQTLLAEAEDDDMREFLEAERDDAAAKAEGLQDRLLRELLPKDPRADNNAVVEIRAGTGGEEAALFAGDLFGMYSSLAERKGWKVQVVGENESDMGGYKEVVFLVEGRGAYGIMEHESGVHRVQRVPKTESQGRIHTSAATVAVLPEAEAVDVELRPDDLKIESFRAGGPGGQHMQKNDTAVRITHLPTAMSVVSSSQRSQHQNREQALRLLRSRLLEMEIEKQHAEEAASRREQVKSGDRSEKIRTYNWPQDRLTDHRIGLTIHNLPAIMDGELDEVIDALRENNDAERLRELAGEE
jgi:peptide chain release factor 1